MLTQDERDRLARWMGWTLIHYPDMGGRVVAGDWWDKHEKRLTTYEAWLNPPTGNDMLMLLERAAEEAHARKAEFVFRSVYYWDGSGVHWVAYEQDALGHGVKQYGPVLESAPLAVCRAILDMLDERE